MGSRPRGRAFGGNNGIEPHKNGVRASTETEWLLPTQASFENSNCRPEISNFFPIFDLTLKLLSFAIRALAGGIRPPPLDFSPPPMPWKGRSAQCQHRPMGNLEK
jgi:hypothetical protein